MGFFNKQRTDGVTYDGQGEERRGLIDIIKYNGVHEDIIWKPSCDNISTGAQLVVNQSQEAIFLRGGAVCDVFGPGIHTLSSNNLPILQKLINLPFGGKTPFAAEVWFVNLTTKRELKFGTPNQFMVRDITLGGLRIGVKAYGVYGIKVTDGSALLRELVGTEHSFTTGDIINGFRAKINEVMLAGIPSFILQRGMSVVDLPMLLPDLSKHIRLCVQEEFSKYGLSVENFNFEGFNVDESNPKVQEYLEKQSDASAARFTAQREVIEAQGHAEALRVQGVNYQQERQFDVMETAAGNEGAGQFMGAGMGLGMGFGMGNAFGTQINTMAGSLNSQNTPPPPPPLPAVYHVLVNGAQQGPNDMNSLQQLVRNNILTRETYVWKNGMPQWTKAGECMDLQNLFGAVPPPPPVL